MDDHWNYSTGSIPNRPDHNRNEATIMKKRILFTALFAFCVVLLTACQCEHDWVEADCTTAKTCVRCKEVIGEPLGHAWVPATCTEAKFCSACGRTEGSPADHNWIPATCTQPMYCADCFTESGTTAEHDWIPAVNRNGIEGFVCADCQEVSMPTNYWIPLTECEKTQASNEEAHFQDIVVGDWDTRAGELPDSIRFCVSGKESYKKTHYCIYKLNGNFDYLSGLISFMDKSDKYATAKIQIYLDNALEFESDTISDLSNDESFTLDVRGVNTVRIVCTTKDQHTAYCVLSASVY